MYLAAAIGKEVVVDAAPELICVGVGVHQQQIEQGIHDHGVNPEGDVDSGRAPLIVGKGWRRLLDTVGGVVLEKNKEEESKPLVVIVLGRIKFDLRCGW